MLFFTFEIFKKKYLPRILERNAFTFGEKYFYIKNSGRTETKRVGRTGAGGDRIRQGAQTQAASSANRWIREYSKKGSHIS